MKMLGKVYFNLTLRCSRCFVTLLRPVGRDTFEQPVSCIAAFSTDTGTHKANDESIKGSGMKEKLKSSVLQKYQLYEDFIGLTEVKAAQTKVITAETKFMELQEKRRECQQKLHQLQSKLKEVHTELDKTTRGEDRYLYLVTQEHSIIREERSLLEEFNFLEKAERDYFSALSLAVRESHEKERAQAERTKYWSIIGSICGAVIGIVGTTINNRMRMKELRQLVVTSASNPNFQPLLETVASQQEQMGKFVIDLKQLLGDRNKQISTEPIKIDILNKNTAELLNNLKQHDDRLTQDMKEVKALVAAQLSLHRVDASQLDQPVTVLIGEDFETIMKKSEQNLEWKMKVNSLATVALVYGAFAVTVPIIMQMFKGAGG